MAQERGALGAAGEPRDVGAVLGPQGFCRIGQPSRNFMREGNTFVIYLGLWFCRIIAFYQRKGEGHMSKKLAGIALGLVAALALAPAMGG